MRNQFRSIARHLQLNSPRIIAVSLLAFAAPLSAAHATWSVVAVDPITGEVGAAGASCYPGVDTIASVVPGKGAVVAQGLTSYPGRDHAARMLQEGSGAEEVAEAITSGKVDKSFFVVRQLRQYGVASLNDGEAGAASFTGMFTGGARGGREAEGVSVQGNILESRAVLDQTLARFVDTPKACGMAVALLNGMEAGAREGGDARCPAEQSALSAFLIVAQPGDSADAPAIRLITPNQDRGGANPVMMLRGQLRDHLAEQGISLEDCGL
jgi:uncharacterized Ntn-hydrolase superfamily protein